MLKARSIFSGLMITGLLAVSSFSAYMWASAAPVKVPKQTTQPAISKISLKANLDTGKNALKTYQWDGAAVKPPVVQLPTQKTVQFYAQVGGSQKVPTWYAFDSFTVSKGMSTQSIDKIVKSNVPSMSSDVWTKTRSHVVNIDGMDAQNHVVVVAYVMNADPVGGPGLGRIDDAAYMVLQPLGTTPVDVVPPAPLSKGGLTVADAVEIVAPSQFVMGQVNQKIFRFKLVAGDAEDVSVTQLPISFNTKGNDNYETSDKYLGVVKNIRLYDGDVQVGSSVAALMKSAPQAAPGIGQAVFSKLKVAVKKGTSKTLTVVADISASPDIYSGVQFTPQISPLWKYTSDSATVTAVDSSGLPVTVAGDSQTNIKGKMHFVYKTVISVAHAASAPSGAASKGTGQVVAKYVVSNSANVNNQAATIKVISPELTTSIVIPDSASRVLKVFGSPQLMNSKVLTSKTYVGSSSGKPEKGPLEEVVIEPGTSQQFTVTFDSVDAYANNTLKVDLTQGDIVWSDGVSESINWVNSLPLAGKTLIY